MSADIHITLFTLMSDKNFSFEELATSASLARGVYGYVRDKATGTEDVNNKNGKLIDLGVSPEHDACDETSDIVC